MKQRRCERENTKEEEEKEKKRDWREHLSHWRMKRRWNFGNEKRKKEWSGEMGSKQCRPHEWVGKWEKLGEGKFLEVPSI